MVAMVELPFEVVCIRQKALPEKLRQLKPKNSQRVMIKLPARLEIEAVSCLGLRPLFACGEGSHLIT
jgi:hypothetical protein